MQQNSAFSVVRLFREFAEATSMHGLKFIIQKQTLLIERVLWAILFIGGFLFAIAFSWNLWESWKTLPVIITIQTANYPINIYSFPTVTVCSVNKVSTHALEDWMETLEVKPFRLEEIRRILEIMTTNRLENKEEVEHLNGLLRLANITSKNGKYEEIMKTVSPNCSEMLLYCAWEGVEEDCESLFETEATDDGFCCSFNSIVIRHGKETSRNKTLRKARTSGVNAGLTVILDAEIDDYNVTSSSVTGFKVSIQEPNDFPRTGQIGFLASPGHQIDAAVTGETELGANDLKIIPLERRLCVTDDEISLKYFEDYTGPYCQLDCLTQLLYAECGCIPYYYPVNADLPVCDLPSYVCLQRISEYVLNNQTACYCPDTCNNVWYTNEISSGTFPNSVSIFPRTLLNQPKFQGLSPEEFNRYARQNFVQLNVFFKTVSGLCYIIEERTNWTSFISAAGGLLSLGFGFSIISAAELLYFFLIRWCYHWYQSKKQQKRRSFHPQHPTRPLNPSRFRDGNFGKFRIHAEAIRPPRVGRLPQTYKAPGLLSLRKTQLGYSVRPTSFQAWVEY